MSAKNNNKNNKRKAAAGPSAAELELEDMLFGKKVFEFDHSAASSSSNGDGQKRNNQQTLSSGAGAGASASVWADEEEESLEVDLNRNDRLKKLKTSDILEGRTSGSGSTVTGTDFTNVLQERFAAKKTLEWAQLPANNSSADGAGAASASLLSSSDALTSRKGVTGFSSGSGAYLTEPISAGKINIQRVANGNVSEPSKKSITSVQFYAKDSDLLLVAGQDKTVRFFKIDGEKNEKQLAVKFNDMQISHATFVGDTTEVLVAGRKPYYHSYDTVTGTVAKIQGPRGKNVKSLEHMVCSPNSGQFVAFAGAAGHVHVADSRSKSWVCDVKMNTAVRSMCFAGDGNTTLVTSGVDAEVYIWDLRFNGKCVNRFQHDDGMCTSALAAYCPHRYSSSSTTNNNRGSGNDSVGFAGYSLDTPMLAVGSESGVVSLFDGRFVPTGGNNKLLSLQMPTSTSASITGNNSSNSNRKNSIFNLTTKITSMAYHPSGQVLALASKELKDQLKLVHLPSRTVFTNWPTQNTPLGHVECLSFSASGSYMAVGNSKGKVLLYRLNHFTGAGGGGGGGSSAKSSNRNAASVGAVAAGSL